MTKKVITIIVVILVSTNAFSQKNENKIDLRFGIGFTLLGSGDMISTTIENQFNFKINRYFASSASISFGRSNYGISETASFMQGNTNFYISPFSNRRRNDFRVGTGLSYYHVSDFYISGQSFENGVLIDEDFVFEKRKSLGYNIIIENTFAMTDNFIVGIKLYTQPYINGDINSGFLLKFGVQL